jgi:hypothetical protein
VRLSNRQKFKELTITASGYEQKALMAQPADTSPGTLGGICPGGQATMVQFLPPDSYRDPAKDKFVTVNGFVQRRK